jgi:hypothetical protein
MYQTSRSLGVIWSDLFKDRVFLFGLIFKIVFIILFIPEIQTEWFVPFIVEAIESPSMSPWFAFVNSGGDPLAFPYGPIMFLVHLPSTFLGWVVDVFTGLSYFSGLGFRVSLLGADLLLLSLLLQQFEKHWRGLLLHYWLSSVIIFTGYAIPGWVAGVIMLVMFSSRFDIFPCPKVSLPFQRREEGGRGRFQKGAP